MELEIERKWLVPADRLLTLQGKVLRDGFSDIRQGYLSPEVRVRITNGDAILCIKRRLTLLTVREFNYSIPMEDAELLLEDMDLIIKHRNNLPEGYTLDQFASDLDGLVLVEKEFESEELAAEELLPEWLEGCPEVTGDETYINANLGGTMFVEGLGVVSGDNLLTGDEEEIDPNDFHYPIG